MVEWQTRVNDGVEESKATINGYEAEVDNHDRINVYLSKAGSVLPTVETRLRHGLTMEDGRRVAEAIAKALP